MRDMKDSHIGWIKEVPSEWTISRVKNYFINKKIVAGIKSKEYERLALTLNGVIKRAKDDSDGLQPSDFNTYQILEKDNLIFKLIDLQNVSTSRVGLSPYTGLVSPAYIRLIANEGIIPEYAEKFFLMMWHNEIFNQLGDAGVRSSLSATDLLNLPIIIPSIDEQKRIAVFINNKETEINNLKTELEEQISVLEEYKKSVITEAVTKGLNPDVEMKDSGIEWIGMIPAHWDIHPVYHYFGERKVKNSTLKEQNLLSLSYGKIVRKDIESLGGLLPANFNTYNIVEAGDIIIRPTDLQNDKRSLRTGLVTEHGIITSAYIDLMPKADVNSKYFHYLLHSYDVMKAFYNMGNGVRQGLNYSEFAKLMIFAPSAQEQKEIVRHLDTKCAEIDGAIKDKKEQLETLEEYKKSLIYEYVTGKKEVV